MSNAQASWEKFLHPETLKGNLIAISLFITAFENFKNNVIEKPEIFFSNAFDENGPVIDVDQYKEDVLSLSNRKNKLYASLLWFQKLEAIDAVDIDSFDGIRKHRNELAHEPMSFLASSERNFDISKFQELIRLLSKIEKWWFINFEASIDPDMFPDGIDPESVIPAPVWSLQLMLDIALGNEPEEGFYYNAFTAPKT